MLISLNRLAFYWHSVNEMKTKKLNLHEIFGKQTFPGGIGLEHSLVKNGQNFISARTFIETFILDWVKRNHHR